MGFGNFFANGCQRVPKSGRIITASAYTAILIARTVHHLADVSQGLQVSTPTPSRAESATGRPTVHAT
jgi:hypothetical protein